MPTFRYQATGADQRRETGELEADSVQQALEQLAARGLTIQSIGYAQPGEARDDRTPPRAGPVEAKPLDTGGKPSFEHELLESHLARVFERGAGLVPALRAYAVELASGPSRRELLTVCRILEEGDPAASLRGLASLPEYWIPLLSAAAQTGDVERVLSRFFAESQRAATLNRQWRVILSYPLTLALIATTLILLISYFIVPVFREIFDDFQLQLPHLTQLVLYVSWAVIHLGGISAILFFIAAGVFLLLGSMGWFGAAGAAPARWLRRFFGRSAVTAQFSRFVAELLEADIDVPNAVRIAGYSTRRPGLGAASRQLADMLESGQGTISRRVRRRVTNTVLHALQAEMPSASRIRLLREISCCHAERADDWLSWTHGLAEPVMILAVGLLVGIFLLALLLPLHSLIRGLW